MIQNSPMSAERLSGSLRDLVLVLLTCLSFGCSQKASDRKNIAVFERVLPWLIQHQIQAYSDLDWCSALLVGSRGYAQTEYPGTCLTFDAPVQPFTAEGRALFDELKQKLVDISAPVTRLKIDVDSKKESIQLAEFWLMRRPSGYRVYVFDPNAGASLKNSDKINYTYVGGSWWRIELD